MIFEGEYLNGKRNGKGKEYNKEGKLIFEGEYLNGFKWNGQVYGFQNVIACQLQEGKGALNRFFCLKGNIILPQGGEFIKGELKAKVSIYDNVGRTIFEGEFLDGKRNGKGKETENK